MPKLQGSIDVKYLDFDSEEEADKAQRTITVDAEAVALNCLRLVARNDSCRCWEREKYGYFDNGMPYPCIVCQAREILKQSAEE